jgi:dTDP-4-amino-4,6-dideoxygalactose transaminase
MYRHLPSAQPGRMPVAEDIAARILCLPIYPDLTHEDQDRVVTVLRQAAHIRCVSDPAVVHSTGHTL